jgi:hypothetical protein
METDTLYQRLGGSEGIRALVDDIVSRHAENPAIGVRFQKDVLAIAYSLKGEILHV